jgi:nicotinamidase-related amidase
MEAVLAGFEVKNTAILTLDIQNGIFEMLPEADKILPNAKRTIDAARAKGYRVIQVGLGFEAGYPEIGKLQSRFSRLKENNRFLKGSASAQFHPSLLDPGDTIIYKQRVSGFSDNSLEMILRANAITHLVLMGISTSGIVLSTIRRAQDLDFQCAVVEDACHDRDAEVHRVLTQKVFAAQGTVLSSLEFERALGI